MLDSWLGLGGEMVWYLPLLIFFARICDVSLGTVRTILVIGGHPYISSLLGFFEVTIWVLAVGGVLAYLSNPFALLGYAGGFAVGVIVGMMIEERLALGYRMVRAISTDPESDLSAKLRELDYRVTRVDGKGRDGDVELAFLIVQRRAVPALREAITKLDPGAYISVNHVERPTLHALGQGTRFAAGRIGKSGISLRK